MKKKIAVLGSTGSIGKTTLKIISNDKINFDIALLSTNKNVALLFKQAKYFNVKNVIILNTKKYFLWKKKFEKNKIKIFNSYRDLNKIIKKKLDYTINAISGLDGLEPTIKIIKHTKKIAIANKESIICGWNLIEKELEKNRTEFIPVDSEHFSIYSLINKTPNNQIKKIIITASGGPFLKKSIKSKVKISDALNHPNWKMGKKISIDSATLMNKVFEVIEAKKIFKLKYDKIQILINPNSYLHAVVIFNNGTIKLLVHETKMDIPIYNSIYSTSNYKLYKTKNLDLNKINNLFLSKPDSKKFKSIDVLSMIPKKDSLFETILITINDELVDMFLNKKIEFNHIAFYLVKIIKFKLFKKYYTVKPSSINQILKVRNLTKEFLKKYFK